MATGKIPTNCMDCEFHLLMPDPDPTDWFCDDDEKVVCKKSRCREVTVACRPYNTRKECVRPTWCPLVKKK